MPIHLVLDCTLSGALIADYGVQFMLEGSSWSQPLGHQVWHFSAGVPSDALMADYVAVWL